MATLPGPYNDERDRQPDIAPAAPEASDLVRLLNVVLRSRVQLLWIPAAAAFVIGLLVLLQPRAYRSEATFAPQQNQRTPLAFTGLAAQLGVALPSAGLEQSAAFYEDLVRSREILRNVAQASYADVAPGGTLVEVYEIDEADSNARVYAAIERLRRSVRVGADSRTGVVTVSVAARSPLLAQAIAENVITEINTFNLTRRQSVAEAERSFVEVRLETASGELAATETALRRFDERNLRIDNSPELRLERERLQRQVGMRQEVVTMLTQAYEQARIDEVRNTPVITVVEPPSLPVKAEPRGTVRYALLAFLVTGFVMTCFVFGRELYRGIVTGETAAHQEFRQLSRSMRLPWRRRG